MSPVSTPERLTATAESANAPWYATAFDRVWLRCHPERGDAEAQRFAPHLIRLLGLKAGQRILDVACGAGRYCRAFADRGLKVTGIDLSAAMLEVAREKSPYLPGMPVYMRWDARSLPFHAQFEGAVSLFTSLGYFDSRQDDLLVLKGVERALVPGGRFLIDFLNPAHVRAHLVAEERLDVDGLTLDIRRTLEEGAASGPHVVKHVRAHAQRAEKIEAEIEERVRLYEPDEIDALLTESGLVPEGPRCGSLDGAPFTAESERYVRVAQKPLRRR